MSELIDDPRIRSWLTYLLLTETWPAEWTVPEGGNRREVVPRFIVWHQNRYWAAGVGHAPCTIWASCFGHPYDMKTLKADGRLQDQSQITITVQGALAITGLHAGRRDLTIEAIDGTFAIDTADGGLIAPRNVRVRRWWAA